MVNLAGRAVSCRYTAANLREMMDSRIDSTRAVGAAIAQWLSWIHGRDLVRAIRFLLARPELSGPVNLAAPHPLPQREFIRELRAAQRIPAGLLDAGFEFDFPDWSSAAADLLRTSGQCSAG